MTTSPVKGYMTAAWCYYFWLMPMLFFSSFLKFSFLFSTFVDRFFFPNLCKKKNGCVSKPPNGIKFSGFEMKTEAEDDHSEYYFIVWMVTAPLGRLCGCWLLFILLSADINQINGTNLWMEAKNPSSWALECGINTWNLFP